MTPGLPAQVDGALRDLRTLSAALALAELGPPATIGDAVAAAEWARTVKPRWEEARKESARALTLTTALAQRGADPSEEQAWRDLDDAVRALESELARPSTLQARIAEGRRSMATKAEKVVQENLNPVVHERGGQLVAGLDGAGLAVLRKQLPDWASGWADYAFRGYAVDLQRLVGRLWAPMRGDLPVPPPQLRPLDVPAVPAPPDFPEVVVSAEQIGVTGVFKHARSALYGLMSLGFLFGIRAQGSGGSGLTVVMVLAALGAVAFGYVQHRGERGRHRERVEGEVQRKAEQAVREVLRAWYDRRADKITESALAQLHERRSDLVRWARNAVAPARRKAQEALAQRRAEADEARGELTRLQAAKRDHERARRALMLLERAG